jgi:hypothetical protein
MRTSEFGVAHSDISAREFTVILWHGKQNLGKGRCLRAFEAPQPLVLGYFHHDDGGLAMLGNRLRRALCRLDDLAEAILGILYRPIALGHAFDFLARNSS